MKLKRNRRSGKFINAGKPLERAGARPVWNDAKPKQHNVVCVCGAPMKLRISDRFFFADGRPKPWYGCSRYPRCKEMHSAHPDGSPMGVPADADTRRLRTKVHEMLTLITGDPKQQSKWLSENGFGGHVGSMDAKQCIDAINKIKGF